jgi:hypothetical protein
LRTESISRDGLRHFRRKLECSRIAWALSALLIWNFRALRRCALRQVNTAPTNRGDHASAHPRRNRAGRNLLVE